MSAPGRRFLARHLQKSVRAFGKRTPFPTTSKRKIDLIHKHHYFLKIDAAIKGDASARIDCVSPFK